MKIAIQTRDAELTDDLRRRVEQRLAFALSQCQDRIRGVVVGLSEINTRFQHGLLRLDPGRQLDRASLAGRRAP